MRAGPLSDLRVLDFGRYISAPFCSAMLADLGAEVIRIEPRGGSDDRVVMPITARTGALHLQVNRNKRSLAIDLKRPEATEIVRRLVAGSDVVITNMPPRGLVRLGLDYRALKEINPRIIHTNITAFGDQGPERNSVGFDGTGQSMSGAVHLSGWPGRPVRSAVSFVDFGTAMAAAFGTVAAVYERTRTGLGQEVKSSLLRTALTMMNPILIEQAVGTRTRVATGNRSPIAGPSDVFQTSDGWLMVQVIGQDMFRRWAELIGEPDLPGKPLYIDDIRRGENGEALSALMQAWCTGKTSAECLEQLRAARIPGCRVLSPKEVLMEPQNVEGGFFEWIEPAGLDQPIPLVRPVQLGSLEPGIRRPAPSLGEDAGDILREFGYSDAEIGLLSESGVLDLPEAEQRVRPRRADGG